MTTQDNARPPDDPDPGARQTTDHTPGGAPSRALTGGLAATNPVGEAAGPDANASRASRRRPRRQRTPSTGLAGDSAAGQSVAPGGSEPSAASVTSGAPAAPGEDRPPRGRRDRPAFEAQLAQAAQVETQLGSLIAQARFDRRDVSEVKELQVSYRALAPEVRARLDLRGQFDAYFNARRTLIQPSEHGQIAPPQRARASAPANRGDGEPRRRDSEVAGERRGAANRTTRDDGQTRTERQGSSAGHLRSAEIIDRRRGGGDGSPLRGAQAAGDRRADQNPSRSLEERPVGEHRPRVDGRVGSGEASRTGDRRPGNASRSGNSSRASGRTADDSRDRQPGAPSGSGRRLARSDASAATRGGRTGDSHGRRGVPAGGDSGTSNTPATIVEADPAVYAARLALLDEARSISVDDRSGTEQWRRIVDRWKAIGGAEDRPLWQELCLYRDAFTATVNANRQRREADAVQSLATKRQLIERARKALADERTAEEHWAAILADWDQAGRGPQAEEDRLRRELDSLRVAFDRARDEQREERRAQMRQRAAELRARAVVADRRAADVLARIEHQRATSYADKDPAKRAHFAHRQAEAIAALERERQHAIDEADQQRAKADSLDAKANQA